jgi:hypothetical protein
MNHDSIIDTLEKISTLATSGDMIIFDSHLPYGHPEDPRSILDRDPRLSGTLPLSYIKAVENMFEPVLQEADSTISRIAWSYEICKHINHSDDTLISYSIDMQADLIREHRHPQSISILRIHRTSPEAVVRNLAILRWKMVGSLLQGQLTDMNYPAQVYMFVKE